MKLLALCYALYGLAGRSLLRGLLCCRTLLGYCLLGRSLFLRGYCHLPSLGLNVESIWDLDDTNMMTPNLVPPRLRELARVPPSFPAVRRPNAVHGPNAQERLTLVLITTLL